MNRLQLLTLLLIMVASATQAELGDTPDQTLLWGQYRAVRIVDGYALGLSDEGVAVCRWDEQSEEFVHTNQLIIKDRPRRMRVFGDVLVVRSLHDSLVFADIGSLPDIARLGAIHPGTEFDDFVVHDNDLYISVWFQGVWRFTGPSFSQMAFADSVMRPILCSQMHVDNQTLYVLDEYNGLARYDLNDPGFGRFIDYLWVPFRVSTFFPFDDRWLISGRNHGLYLGEPGYAGSGITGEIGSDQPAAQRVWTTDSLLITASGRFACIYDRYSLDSLEALALGEDPIDGDVAYLQGEHKLVLPGSRGGVVLYSLEHFGDADLAYYRPGPIAGLTICDSFLFTGGRSNPVDAFAMNDRGLDLHHTLYDDLTDIIDLTRNGDTLVVLYGGLNRVALIASCGDPDSAYIERSFMIEPVSPRRVEWYNDWPLGEAGLVVIGEEDIAVYTVTDYGGIVHTATWSSPYGIEDAIRVGSTLAIATTKRNILLYRLDDELNSTWVREVGLASATKELSVHDGLLMFFSGSSMYLMDVSNPATPRTETEFEMAKPVTQAIMQDDQIYTVGPGGVAVYNWSGETPELVESGGLPGNRIAVMDDMIATTDGNSVHYYRLGAQQSPQDQQSLPALFAVAQNYPNPFNSRTVIQFSLSASADVRIDIFNTLGRRVNTLSNGSYPSGQHTVSWDGCDSGGREVASGVYFYRVQAGSQVTSRKMVLLK